ncbi:hypothetical protein E3N88_31845 [Mikania micrantha]|uniref:Integrase catalytic domain-containing protein n=1 Tax=Mikania micrantha TaxID=192012 RepID=A0A5N6M7D1_9ASTR|nr:hypothetical protein E3N88_31845 [Mikania micrantha]
MWRFNAEVSFLVGSAAKTLEQCLHLAFTKHDNKKGHGKRFGNQVPNRFNLSQKNWRDDKGKQVDKDERSFQGSHYNKSKKTHKPMSKDHQEVLLNEKEIKPSQYGITNESLWYLDNDASNHMTGNKEHFRELDKKVSGRVRFGDGSFVEIEGKGSILLECKNKEQRVISHVYYIPNLKNNILSLGQLTENGCKVLLERDSLFLYDNNETLLMKVTRSKNRLYNINLRIGAPVCLLSKIDEEAWLWHARLGHINFDTIKLMTHKNLVQGVPRINHASQICDACLLGKHIRAPFPNQARFKSDKPLELVCGDLCGPISPPTHSGKKYIFLLVDDCTRYMWIYLLSSKDQAFGIFREFKQLVENEVGTKLKTLRTDRGGEFTSSEFNSFYKEHGIALQLTALQQNGVVERRNRTMLSTTRSIMKAMSMPQSFWGEAVRHTIYVLNRTPTKALKNSTPFEALKGRKLNLKYLRVFGCVAYAKEGSKACRLFDPMTKKICISRDVKFLEKESLNWSEYMNEVGSKEPNWIEFIVEEKVFQENNEMVPMTHDDEQEKEDNQEPLSPSSPNNIVTPPTCTHEQSSVEDAECSDILSNPFDHTPVQVKSHFELMSWVCVSDEFDVFSICKAIFKDGRENKKIETLNPLQVALVEKNSKKRIIIVLDDVWNENYNEWELLQRPFTVGVPGSKVIVTTRKRKVELDMDSNQSYPLELLSEEEPLSLFSQHASGKQYFDVNEKLKMHGEDIVKKCGNLPLALRTLGRLFRPKLTVEEWDELLKSEIWKSKNESDILPALMLSYYDLPAQLKLIFVYCSLFPKDELVLLWMAEGFLHESNGNKPMEIFGREGFEELVSRSVAREFFLVLDNKMNISDENEGLEKCYHISFINELYGPQKKFKELQRAKCLRTFLSVQVTSLKHLRYINFSSTKITCLPENVGDLQNLQSLLLSGCLKLSSLPTSTSKLINLRHLDISSTPNLKKMPLGIGGLTGLQTLSKVIIGEDDKFKVSDLKGFLNIQGQLLIERLQNDEKTEYEVLDGLRPFEKLRSLGIMYYMGEKFPSWVGHSSFVCLTALALRFCKSCKNLLALGLLPFLQKLLVAGMDGLERLGSEFLTYSNSRNVVSFPSFEVLVSDDMKNWVEWSANGGDIAGAFPCVRDICIMNCPKLNAVTIKLTTPSLQGLCVEGCSLVMLRSMVAMSSSIARLKISNIKELTELDGEIVKHLNSVKYLVISFCDKLTSLLVSNAEMREIFLNLQKFKVSFCKQLLSLGEEELQSVKEVEIDSCEKLESYKCPSSIEKWKLAIVSWLDNKFLSSLEHLYIWNMVKRTLFPEDFLVHLTKLVIDDCDNIESIPDNGYGFLPPRLRYLHIGLLLIEGLHKAKNAAEAKEVNLHQKKGICDLQFPGWVGHSSFVCLTVLALRFCKSCKKLTALGLLPLLQKLLVAGMDGLEILGYEFLAHSNSHNVVAFPSLEVLVFDDMKNWVEWSASGGDIAGVFPCLRDICIINCPKLNAVTIKLTTPSLQGLRVEGCFLAMLKGMVVMSSSIARLKISNIKGLTELDGEIVEHLNSVKYLEISFCDELTSLLESNAVTPEIFLNLQTLKVSWCKQLLSFGNEELQSVKEVEIEFCGSLKSYNCPSRVEKLEISNCSSLASSSFPTVDNIRSTLKSLYVLGCDNLEVSWLDNKFLSSLEHLYIWNMVNRTLFPQGFLVHLTKLVIDDCNNIESIPDNGYGFLPSRLRYLHISKCKNLNSFPHKHLQSLESLKEMIIRMCPNLDNTFPSGSWPPNLSTLRIGGLKKTISEWGMQNFPTTLVTLGLYGDEDSRLVTFAEAKVLPSSLTSLNLFDFKKLESLSEGLQHLTCLQHLQLYKCTELRFARDIASFTFKLDNES